METVHNTCTWVHCTRAMEGTHHPAPIRNISGIDYLRRSEQAGHSDAINQECIRENNSSSNSTERVCTGFRTRLQVRPLNLEKSLVSSDQVSGIL